VRDENRVVVGQERAVVLDEVEQMRHLFKVGRNVGIVAVEVRVVELNVDDVTDISAGRVQFARAFRGCRTDRGDQESAEDCRETAS